MVKSLLANSDDDKEFFFWPPAVHRFLSRTDCETAVSLWSLLRPTGNVEFIKKGGKTDDGCVVTSRWYASWCCDEGEEKFPCAAICLGPQGFTFVAKFIKKTITNGMLGSFVASHLSAQSTLRLHNVTKSLAFNNFSIHVHFSALGF